MMSSKASYSLKRVTMLAVSIAITLIVVAFVHNPLAIASPTGTVSQTISTGTLATDIKNDSNVSVPSPSFSMSSAVITTSCQTTTSTYGTNNQRIYVDNPGDADNGWTLSIAATDGGTALWESGVDNYDFDDPAGAGCANGQLSLDPTASTLVMENGTPTNVTKGAADAFNSNSSITLLTAGAASDDIWRGYLTGIGVSQTIPSSTPAGSYSIDLTQTVVSN